MNRNLVATFGVMAAVTCATAQTATNPKPPLAPPSTEAKTNAVLGVETFMRGVDHYQGRVQVDRPPQSS